MALGTTKLVTNYVTAPGSSVVTARTSFALVANPESNLLLKDRAAKTRFISSYSNIVNDLGVAIDLGESKTLNVFGILGLVSPLGTQPSNIAVSVADTYPDPVVASCAVNTNGTVTRGSAFPSTVRVGQRISWAGIAATTYVTAMNGPIGTATSLTVSPAPAASVGSTTVTLSDERAVSMPSLLTGGVKADRYVLVNGAVSARYVFMTFPGWSPVFATCSTVLAGWSEDLGIAYAAGSSENRLLARVTNRAADGRIVATRVGEDRVEMSYNFPRVQSSTRDAIEAAASGAPFLLITPNGTLREVDVPSQSVECSTVWGSPPLYDVSLKMESLP